MTNLKNSITKYWYLYIVGAVIGVEALVFAIFRQDSYIQVHDNLDLFIAHYQMIKLNHGWFAHGATMPMLHGINRDLLGSEFLLYNILYIIFPSFTAYMIGMFLKIFIGMFGFVLFAKDICEAKISQKTGATNTTITTTAFTSYRPVAYIIGLAYGLIPVFPTYGIAFTSVPLIIWLLRRLYIETDRHKRIPLYIGVFCYPVLSYFSYHGFFILAYMCAAVIILWIHDRKFPVTTFASICILACGYILFEYRLFKAMLFDDTITIRTTMVRGDMTFIESIRYGFSELVNASFHSQDSHTYFILIVVVIALIIININHIRAGEGKKISTDPVNLVFEWIVFNCLIFGLCEFAPFRTLLETIVPPLKGFDFSRTSFFNPFLWYAILYLICVRLINGGKKANQASKDIEDGDSAAAKANKTGLRTGLAYAILVIALAVVTLAPQTYNDFYYTIYNQAYKLIKHQDTSTVNYREFYSTDLFDQVKSAIDYNGEWSAAYGIHPAVLNFNGISSVDGYLGMYSQDYKEQWIAIEKEAFEGSPSLKEYYEDWGARVCLYSGNDENTYAPYRVMELEDKSLKADTEGLKKLDCKYIFSRVEFDNADEKNLTLIGTYSDEESPYVIFVYKIR